MVRNRSRAIAGGLVLAVGVLLALAFTTAEAFYPGYSTSTQTISALGSDTGTPESRLVFNSAMVVSGLLLAVAAYFLRDVYDSWVVPALAAVTGVVGFAGVGVFPSQTGAPHALAALVSFGGSGVIALAVARAESAAFQYASAVLGVAVLLTLAGFVGLGGGTPLGIGGLERWVAYLGILWAASYGGFLLARE
ncbi:DUF998 domain-containing protein [Salarchaeum sp. JOR-1]|uniref:DUF998 domain-containing protein n=1 Tax=Salarchaeum sp. JOR-1 TaxID=2599399 RepID=UPI001198A597|nr:DUF998 domain-containing protein [Salarchaeum sp. JOR-1]QDX41263.1 DUF998 domain-containing protein [Salarchaeum sp. JOR-1]